MDKVIVYGPEIRQLYLRQLHLKYLLEAIPGAEVIDIDKRIPNLEGCRVFTIGTQMFAGSDRLNAVARRMRDCEYLVFVTDDYVFPLTTQYRHAVEGKPNAMICATPQYLEWFGHLKSSRWCQRVLYVHWQKASYNPLPWREPTKEGVIYYGIYRPKRLARFQKYFGPGIVLSGSDKARDKFWEAGLCKGVTEVAKIELPAGLQDYCASFYIEDEGTPHTGIANRWYECLSAGVAMFVDNGSASTFEADGVDPTRFLVSNREQMFNMDWRQVRQIQSGLRRDYIKELREEIQEAVCSL